MQEPNSDEDDEEERREDDSAPSEETEVVDREGSDDDSEARRVRMLLTDDDDEEDDDDVPDFFEGVMTPDLNEETEQEQVVSSSLPEATETVEAKETKTKKTCRRKSSVTNGFASPILTARTRTRPVASISGPPQSHTFLRRGSFNESADKTRHVQRPGSDLRRQLTFKEDVGGQITDTIAKDTLTTSDSAEKANITLEASHSEGDTSALCEIVEKDVNDAFEGSDNEPTTSVEKNDDINHTALQDFTKPKPKTRLPSTCINRFSDLVPPPPKDPIPIFHARMAPQRREIPPPDVKTCTPMVHELRKRAMEAEKNSKTWEEKVLDLETKICVLRDAMVEVVRITGGNVLLESWVAGKIGDRKEAHSSRKVSAIENVLLSLSSKIPLAYLYQIKPKTGASRTAKLGDEALHAKLCATNAKAEECITNYNASVPKLDPSGIGEQEKASDKHDHLPDAAVASSVSRSELPGPPTRRTDFPRPQTTSSVPFTDRERYEEDQGSDMYTKRSAKRSLPLNRMATSPRSARRFNASCPGFLDPNRNISTAPASLKSSSVFGRAESCDANAILEIHALQAQISKHASALKECIDALAEEQRQTDVWRRKYDAENAKFEKWIIRKEKEELQRELDRRRLNTWNANPLVCELVTETAVNAFGGGERVANIGRAKAYYSKVVADGAQMPIMPLGSSNDHVSIVPSKTKPDKWPSIPAHPTELNERSRSRSPSSQTTVPKLPQKTNSAMKALPPKSALRRTVNDEGLAGGSTNRLENVQVKRKVEWKGDTVVDT